MRWFISSGNGGFSINVPPTYSPGQPLTLNLAVSSNPTFIGLALEGFSQSDGSSAGSFVPPSTYFKAFCSNGAGLTHSSGSSKGATSVTWNAPATSVGPVQFQAVVMVSYSIWYTISSSIVNPDGASGGGSGGGGSGGGSGGGGTSGGGGNSSSGMTCTINAKVFLFVSCVFISVSI